MRERLRVALRSSSHSNISPLLLSLFQKMLHSALHRIQTCSTRRHLRRQTRLHSALHRIQTRQPVKIFRMSHSLHSALHRIQTFSISYQNSPFLKVALRSSSHSNSSENYSKRGKRSCCTPLFIAFKPEKLFALVYPPATLHSALHRIQTHSE